VSGTSPWEARRLRAEELRDRHTFAADLMTLYLALLPVQEEAWHAASETRPAAEELPRWASSRVVPGVVEATVAAGPPGLGDRAAAVDEEALAAWLAGMELDPVVAYVARASLGPVLEALGDGFRCAEGAEGLRCPRCGGLPQLGWLASSGDALVSGGRSLLCSRCASSWNASRTVCAACGEADESKLVVYAEHWHGNGDGAAVFPHLRVAGCTTCRAYLIDVDLERDPRAVPEVDELAALPLDLYAADQGLTKVTPNAMGF
jgi:hypothetical protein